MRDVIWVHVKTNHPGWTGLQIAMGNIHRTIAPDTVLSVRPNVAGTEAIVKTAGASDQWKTDNLPEDGQGPVVKTYTRATHDEVLALLLTAPWVIPAGP